MIHNRIYARQNRRCSVLSHRSATSSRYIVFCLFSLARIEIRQQNMRLKHVKCKNNQILNHEVSTKLLALVKKNQELHYLIVFIKRLLDSIFNKILR